MLEVIQLSFDYSDKPLLTRVDFSVEAGQLLHLQGSNGAGKTTLLKLLAGLLTPTHGEIRYRGMTIHTHPLIYKQAICYLGHKTGVNALLTAREHWRFDLHTESNTLLFAEAIKQLGLEGLEDIPCGLLSAGQRQRVGLLRLLVSKATLWLLDEPWVALDKQSMEILKQMISQQMNRGGRVVLTSHQPLPFDAGVYQVHVL